MVCVKIILKFKSNIMLKNESIIDKIIKIKLIIGKKFNLSYN